LQKYKYLSDWTNISSFFCTFAIKYVMMRIVYVTDAFAVWGGMERVLADKMNALTGQYGWAVTLLTVNQGAHPLIYELNPEVYHVDMGVMIHQQYLYQGIRRLIERWKLKRELKEQIRHALVEIRPEVIVCVKLDFVSVLLKLKGEIPLVVESHTLCKSEKMEEVGWTRRLYVWSLKRSIRKADVVVALTEGDAADWRRYNDKVCVIPNTVYLNESSSYASCEQKAVILVGRFSLQKDIDSLLRIWEIVHQRHPDWRLDIYGEGELKEYYLSKIQKINADIHLHEPTSDIMEKYREHSILLLTSLYEPFGLVLPEAMSCGLPVVSFDCPYGPADIITDGLDGFLIKNRNINDYVDKVCLLMENANLRKKMGKAGVKSSQRYDVNRIMPVWQSLFERLK
jgi:glycosyltransferase involved in cell wall biosynthesis